MKKYYAVLYRKDGHISVSKPVDTEEEVIDLLKGAIVNHPDKYFATTWMVREVEDEAPEFLFGHPKSRDIFQNKKIMKSLEANSDD